jgi:hypothetical protein
MEIMNPNRLMGVEIIWFSREEREEPASISLKRETSSKKQANLNGIK